MRACRWFDLTEPLNILPYPSLKQTIFHSITIVYTTASEADGYHCLVNAGPLLLRTVSRYLMVASTAALLASPRALSSIPAVSECLSDASYLRVTTMAPILLVTSTSRVCRQLISTLLSLPDCPAIRVITRSNVKIQETFPLPLRSAPHSIIVSDHFQGQAFEAAFQGVSIVFHNGSAIHALEKAMSLAVIDMAKECGVKHFVFCSVFDPVRTKILTHQIKLA